MIYTSYFGNKKVQTDDNYICVCISLQDPAWLPDIPSVKQLAPGGVIFKKLKNKEINPHQYLDLYEAQIKSDPEALKLIDDLIVEAKDANFVLCCYEKDYAMCHRTRLAQIINERGGDVKELDYETKTSITFTEEDIGEEE